MGSAYVMPASTGSNLPTSSSSEFIDDDSSGESDSPMPPSDLSIDHRHYPPRQSSRINSTYPHNASTEPSRRGESIVDEEKYYKAYWAKLHEMRRHDSQSLPLVPYTDRDFGIMDEKNEYHAPPRNARAYPDFPQRRPLIDYIHNEWRNSSHSYGKSPTERNITSWTQVLSAPLFRRSALIFLLILSLLWGNWNFWVQSEWQEHTYLNNALHGPLKPGLSKFGSNVRPAFRDMIHMRTLDQKLIPQNGDTKRLIVIGDVHGCVKELVALLTELSYNAGKDHLIFAGDMISKGPSSSAVIKLAMSMRASCVRGNHEDRMLLTHRDINSHGLSRVSANKGTLEPPSPYSGSSSDPASSEKSLDTKNFPHSDAVDRELASSFDQKQIDWIASCPVILRLGYIRGMGETHVVHAGLAPGVDLERQEPTGVMEMRTIDIETHVPSRSADGIPWNKLWNKYQSYLPHKARSTVIYGHDSRRGLQLTKYTKGIDTGCVKGGKLTALVIRDDGMQPDIVNVNCKDYRALAAQRKEKIGDLGQS